MNAIVAKVTIDLSPVEDDRTTLDGKLDSLVKTSVVFGRLVRDLLVVLR